ALADFKAGKLAALRKSAKERADEYLLAAHARRGQPRGDDFMLLADPNDLNPQMIIRWQAALSRTPRVWGPWQAYAALPEATFADKGKEVRIGKDVNPLVAKLFGKPPALMKEVASRYAKLLNEIEKSGAKTADERELYAIFHGPAAAPDVREGL